MNKRITITLDETVYNGLHQIAGKRDVSRYIEDLLKPHVLEADLYEGYRQMAADTEREAEAMEWVNSYVGEVTDEAP